MANEVHVQKLLEGAKAWNEWVEEQPADFKADLGEAKLSNANLSEANLLGADLFGADLRGANLSEANLFGADLTHANLISTILVSIDLGENKHINTNLKKANLAKTKFVGAYLGEADLTEAKLIGADLTEAKLIGTNLTEADLVEAKLIGAYLREAELFGADLKGANLSEADLRECHNLRLDGNLVRNTRFSPNAPDPWSVLRRTYTGMSFVFILLGLLIFVAPYFVQIIYWSGVNQAQGVVESMLVWAENNPDEAPALLLDIATDELGLYRTPCLTADGASCGEMRVWQLLIGAHRGFGYWMLAILLILYNAMRLFITVYVGAFREEEERSGHAPSRRSEGRWGFLGGYDFFYQLHRVATIFVVLSVLSFGVHLLPKLFLPVSIPLGGG